MNYRPNYSTTPPVVKNLIIINILFWLATLAGRYMGTDLVDILGMHFPVSEKFKLYQIFTYMFMHDPEGIAHIFFNMFALWMFGRVLESVWGSKRFLFYYLVTGLGALAIHTLVNYIEYSSIKNAIDTFSTSPSPELFEKFINSHLPNSSDQVRDFINSWYNDKTNKSFAIEGLNLMNSILHHKIDIPLVGASGAVFGILLAFGVLFPNTELILLFLPIPIKAKYIVFGYGMLELVLAFTQPGSNIAHFAHLGGMLFGYILIRYWNKNRHQFY